MNKLLCNVFRISKQGNLCQDTATRFPDKEAECSRLSEIEVIHDVYDLALDNNAGHGVNNTAI